MDLGGKVVTCSDASGYIYDEEGFDLDKLAYLMMLKTVRRARVKEYAEKYPNAVYADVDPSQGLQLPVEPQGRVRFPQRHSE